MFDSSRAGKMSAWRERLRRFSRSGMTVESFCTQQRVSVASFYYWRKKLGSETASEEGSIGRSELGPKNAFRPVSVVSRVTPQTMAGRVAILLPGGTRIEVGTGDAEAIRTVVSEVMLADQGLKAGASSC